MSIGFCHSPAGKKKKKNLHITLGSFPAKRIFQPCSQAAPLSHAEGICKGVALSALPRKSIAVFASHSVRSRYPGLRRCPHSDSMHSFLLLLESENVKTRRSEYCFPGPGSILKLIIDSNRKGPCVWAACVLFPQIPSPRCSLRPPSG